MTKTIAVQPGAFITTVNWSYAEITTKGTITIERISGSFPQAGIRVTCPTGSLWHSTLIGESSYIVFGTKSYVLILDREPRAPSISITYKVTLIDFTTPQPTEKRILTIETQSAGVAPPSIQYSQRTGTAFLIYGSKALGGNIQGLGIYRSDNGQILCAGPPPFKPTGQILGEATPEYLIIHYSKNNTSREVRCPLSSG